MDRAGKLAIPDFQGFCKDVRSARGLPISLLRALSRCGSRTDAAFSPLAAQGDLRRGQEQHQRPCRHVHPAGTCVRALDEWAFERRQYSLSRVARSSPASTPTSLACRSTRSTRRCGRTVTSTRPSPCSRAASPSPTPSRRRSLVRCCHHPLLTKDQNHSLASLPCSLAVQASTRCASTSATSPAARSSTYVHVKHSFATIAAPRV